MIMRTYYLIYSLLIICGVIPLTEEVTIRWGSKSKDPVVPTFYVENMARMFFTKDFHSINSVNSVTKFRKPPDYMKHLFRMLNKVIANEASNRNFDRIYSTQNSDSKIQGIWPSKVIQTNTSITFIFTRLSIECPIQAQLVLKPRKTVDDLSSTNTSAVKQQVLDVTENVNNWIKTRQDNSEPLQLVVHIESHQLDSVFTSYKGFLVLYYNINHWQLLAASLRPASRPPSFRQFQRRRAIRQVDLSDSSDDSCQLHEWYVSFAELGWSSWVLAPSGFYANSCFGECPNILMPEKYHASNHAMLRGLYIANSQENNENKVNPACCVPTSLRATSLIYVENNGITIKKLSNVIAEECGCQ